MTEAETEELSQMVCGSSIFKEDCYYRHRSRNSSPYRRDWRTLSSSSGRLIWDGTMFRCSTMEGCMRVTPRAGKLTRWSGQGIDGLKQSIVHRRIKLLKASPEFTTMKLVRSENEIWIDVDGQKIHPKWFQHSWWKMKWQCEDR